MRLHLTRARRRLLTATGIVLLAGLIGTQPALAAERRWGESVVIGKNEVVPDDLYVVAKSIVVDGTIKGDLVAVGANITIRGTVEGDVLAAGQVVVLDGALRDDTRVAGMAVQLGPNARAADDVVVGANTFEQQAGGTIGGDAYLSAAQALLSGTTTGDLAGVFAALQLRGTIAGNADVAVGGGDTVMMTPWSTSLGITTPAVPAGLTVDDGARIGGMLRYTAPDAGHIGSGATLGGSVRTATTAAATPAPYAWLVDLVRRYVTLLGIGLLLLWLAPTWLGRVGTPVQSRPLQSIGWGTVGLAGLLVLLALIPAVAILLMVLFVWLTLGGLAGITFVLGTAAFSAVLTSFAVLVSYLVQIIVGFVAGRWLLGLAAPRWAEGRVAPLALGLALYVALRAVPILGVLTALAVTLLGLGAIWQALSAWLRRRPPASLRSTPMPLV